MTIKQEKMDTHIHGDACQIRTLNYYLKAAKQSSHSSPGALHYPGLVHHCLVSDNMIRIYFAQVKSQLLKFEPTQDRTF